MSDERKQDLLRQLDAVLREIYVGGMEELPDGAVRATLHGLEARRIGIRFQVDVDMVHAPTAKCMAVSLVENADAVILFVLVADAEDLKWFDVGGSEKAN